MGKQDYMERTFADIKRATNNTPNKVDKLIEDLNAIDETIDKMVEQYGSRTMRQVLEEKMAYDTAFKPKDTTEYTSRDHYTDTIMEAVFEAIEKGNQIIFNNPDLPQDNIAFWKGESKVGLSLDANVWEGKAPTMEEEEDDRSHWL